jgi:hypothetical protein
MGVCTPIIHLEDAVIVLEKVAGNSAGKGILHVRIDFHLHYAVIQVFKFSLQAKINEEASSKYLPWMPTEPDEARPPTFITSAVVNVIFFSSSL